MIRHSDSLRIDRRMMLAGGLSVLAWPASAQNPGVIEAPIEVGDHRVSIEARLNGRGPYRFVIDTGAELSGLKVELARELGLSPLRQVRLAGGQFDLFAIDELVLGGAIRQEQAAFFGVTMGNALGGEGLLSAGLISTLDSELLHSESRWRVHPSGLTGMNGYAPVRARLDAARVQGLSSRPHGPVAVGDVEIDAVWDTGGPHGLSLSPNIAERLGLMAPDVVFAPLAGRTIRGRATVPGRLIAAPPLRVGDETFEGVRILVRMDDPFPDTAILGFPVLRSLDLAIADGGRRFGIRRNGLKPVNLPYGLSGLWLDEARGGVVVSVVGTGSPAAAAGLRQGDIITQPGDLSSAIAALRGPAGTTVEVGVRQGGEERTARIVLRDYLAG